MKKRLYTILQWTWGLPQTLIGSAVFIAHIKDHHFDYNGATATSWDRRDGVSLGKFIFVPKGKGKAQGGVHEDGADGDAIKDEFLLAHEYGHTLQSVVLGPAYLLLVGLPSLLWSRLPYFRNIRKRTGRSYYSVIFERTASELGERHSGLKAPRR